MGSGVWAKMILLRLPISNSSKNILNLKEWLPQQRKQLV
jgi:hypothetical protein